MKLNNYTRQFGLEPEFGIKTIFIIFSYLVSMFPVLPFGVRSIILVIWTFFGILCFIKKWSTQINSDKEDKWILVFLFTSFVIMIFSLLYSENVSNGIKRLTKMLPLIILPIVFYLNKAIFTKKRGDRIIRIFCFSVVIFVLYQLILLVFNIEILTDDLSIAEIKSNNLHYLSSISSDQIQQVKIRRLRSFINKIVGSHPTYQGLWISFVVFQLIFVLKPNWKKLRYCIPIILLVSVLIFWMFIISARMPIIASVFAAIVTWIIFGGISFRSFIWVSLVLIAVSFSLYRCVKPINTKVFEIIDNVFTLPTKGNDIYNFNSTNVRNGIYYCAGIVAKNNWLFGTGIGDMQAELSACYDKNIGAKIYKWKKYNSHNQYLFFLIGSGIFGLFSFLCFLFYSFRKIIILGNSSLFYVLVVISMVMMTENIISRSDGVLFFGLFTSMILLTAIENRKT